ncbi:MAG: type II toxin-antitoxin system HicA family toxin [Parafilimonas sp.]
MNFKIFISKSDKNFEFADLVKLLMQLEFEIRIKGSHHIFKKKMFDEIINLQPLNNNKAKPYQVKQVRRILLKYKLIMNEEF